MYDVDSIVLINTGDQLLHAHLTKLVDATNAYAQFQFQIVQPPDEAASLAAADKSGRAFNHGSSNPR